MSMDDRLLLIRNCSFFSQLTEEEIEELHVIHRFIEANNSEYIYFESSYHNKLYFIKEGHIKIGYINENGEEIIKEIINQGEVFGQFTLEKNNLHGEFARAYRSKVSLCAFTIQDFENILQKKPQLALRYSKQVGNKLRNIENRLLNILNKDVKTRLLHFFWQLAEPNITDTNSKYYCITNYLTHDDIAHLIGSCRQTVTTYINDLVQENIIEFTRNKICFPDIKRLHHLVHQD